MKFRRASETGVRVSAVDVGIFHSVVSGEGGVAVADGDHQLTLAQGDGHIVGSVGVRRVVPRIVVTPLEHPIGVAHAEEEFRTAVPVQVADPGGAGDAVGPRVIDSEGRTCFRKPNRAALEDRPRYGSADAVDVDVPAEADPVLPINQVSLADRPAVARVAELSDQDEVVDSVVVEVPDVGHGRTEIGPRVEAGEPGTGYRLAHITQIQDRAAGGLDNVDRAIGVNVHGRVHAVGDGHANKIGATVVSDRDGGYVDGDVKRKNPRIALGNRSGLQQNQRVGGGVERVVVGRIVVQVKQNQNNDITVRVVGDVAGVSQVRIGKVGLDFDRADDDHQVVVL